MTNREYSELIIGKYYAHTTFKKTDIFQIIGVWKTYEDAEGDCIVLLKGKLIFPPSSIPENHYNISVQYLKQNIAEGFIRQLTKKEALVYAL